MFDSLIIGNGEIGSSLLKVLQQRHSEEYPEVIQFVVKAIDIKDSDFEENLKKGAIVLHICIPYSDTFLTTVSDNILKTSPSLVIIHSTVPVGTTRKLSEKFKEDTMIVHSPIQGQHPDLTESILYFSKFIGTDNDLAYECAIAEMSNLKCIRLSSSETSELGKMLSTSYYGLCIAWHREMKRLCDEFNVSFEEAVTNFNLVYNSGYAKFKPNVIRPILTPPEESIGGHCVMQNARLLETQTTSEFLKLIQ